MPASAAPIALPLKAKLPPSTAAVCPPTKPVRLTPAVLPFGEPSYVRLTLLAATLKGAGVMLPVAAVGLLTRL